MRFGALVVALVMVGCTTAGPPEGIEKALAIEPEAFPANALVGPQSDGSYIVATNQRIDAAGDQVLFHGRPVDLALSPDDMTIAVKNSEDIVFIDAETHTIQTTLRIPSGGNSYAGIVWSSDGAMVWTTDTEGFLRGASKDASGVWTWSKEISLSGPDGARNPTPGGFALDDALGVAYVALSRNNAIGVVNIRTGIVEDEIPVGMAPFTALLDGWKLYVTNSAGRRPHSADVTGSSSGGPIAVDPDTGIASSGTVTVIDTRTREAIREVSVGLQPSGMALSPDRKTLYVANANSDTVTLIDTYSDTATNTYGVRPMPGLPFGSAPNAIAVSPDGKRLYVANGGNNAVLAMDAATGIRKGWIPTGWYPGAVLVDEARETIVVANTKGVGGRSADFTATGSPLASDGAARHTSRDHMGSVSFVPLPDAGTLADYTESVAINMRLPQMAAETEPGERRAVPVPSRSGEISPIKHVLYIIAGNRTYDQVFGDLARGNGKAELCSLGRDVTPNFHALAEEFVLLDNFYSNGGSDAAGYLWSASGYATDFLEKRIHGDLDGQRDALAYPSSGFIWDQVLRAGLGVRVYGAFSETEITPRDATWMECYQDYLNGTGRITVRTEALLPHMASHSSPAFPGDSGKVTDVFRASQFISELRTFESDRNLPNFMLISLPNGGISDKTVSEPTERARVADTDLALGRIVDAVTRSAFWPETAIFVVASSAEQGADHVDGQRSVALCISPYAKRGAVVSARYNHNSVLRTIQLILGLPAMTQLDLAAASMSDCFVEQPNLAPFRARPNSVPLDTLNSGEAKR